MRDWFEGLRPRERATLVLGGAVAALILAWSFAWTPLRGANQGLDAAVAVKYGLLADVSRLPPSDAPPAPAARSTESLVLIVDRTHRAHGLGGTLSRNQPEGEDGIRVAFQRAPFAQLVGWLGALRRSHGIVVVNADLDGAQQTGLVNATLVLRRS